jgi:hypothetical protein
MYPMRDKVVRACSYDEQARNRTFVLCVSVLCIGPHTIKCIRAAAGYSTFAYADEPNTTFVVRTTRFTAWVLRYPTSQVLVCTCNRLLSDCRLWRDCHPLGPRNKYDGVFLCCPAVRSLLLGCGNLCLLSKLTGVFSYGQLNHVQYSLCYVARM